ncbi:Sister chromatid cohesion protein 2, partial [Ascosphaera atra]
MSAVSNPKTPNMKKQESTMKSLPTPTSGSKPMIVIPSRSKPTPVKNERNPSIGTFATTPTPASTAAGSVSLTPVVMIPNLPSTYQQDEYVPIPDQKLGSPKRRKPNAQDVRKLAALQVKDQKEEIDAALVTLQDLLLDVFEAEDRVDTGSTDEPEPSSAVFLPGSKVLSAETHHKLHRAIERVVGHKRLKDIPKDYLRRLQKLCEGPILKFQDEDLEIETFISDSEKLEGVHNVLMATGTFLHTMSGENVPHELCPEDIIQQVPRVLSSTLDNLIIPVVEARPGEKDAALWGFATTHAKALSSLCQQTRKILLLLAKFLANVDVAEGIITATEFLAAKLIFVENAPHDKDCALGFQRFEIVRRAAMDVLARIFSKYIDQRSVILDEILISLEKLPSTRQ